jgi:sugar transferase EpsL
MKRAIDVAVAAIGLVVLSPVMAVVAVLVRVRLGRPVLFTQTRPGMHAEPFTIYKFRTMRDGPGTDAERLTNFGRFLRSSSLDELPELVNILKGDMSVVGPRPLLMQYLERYTPEQARRHDVRPGLTGLAQVSGRNATTWADRLGLDVWYVDHRSLWLDLKIIGRTLRSVFAREGISQPGEATMPEYQGPDSH